MKVVFLGAKEIGAACLAFLIEKAKDYGVEIVGVRSRQSESGQAIQALARQHHLPLLESLDQIPECDFIYSVQHHELLKQQHIDRAGQLAVNLHLAPLPEYRGCNQFTFAILEEAPLFGVTIHQMDARIDHGDILFEDRFPIDPDIWVEDLVSLAVKKGIQLFKNHLKDLLTGQYELRPQASFRERGSSRLYYRNEIKEIKEIPLDLSEIEIKKRIRATSMPGFEPPYCLLGNQKVYWIKDQYWEAPKGN